MKLRHILISMATALLTLGSLTSCQKELFQEITDLSLTRCLQPTNLSAKVVSTKGNVILFNWDQGKDTEAYLLYIYSDSEMTKEYKHFTVTPDQLPYTLEVEADTSYWYKVQATNKTKDPSKWAVYGKEIKTYAVKASLYPEITERTSNSISLQWSKEVEDYKQVTAISYSVTGSEEVVKHDLTTQEIEDAAATVTGLAPSTEYDLNLMYLSANRGELVAWTTPDISGTTEVTSVDGLKNAIKTSGAKILLKMEGSPYELAVCEISKGFSIYGEESADGTKPVIKGEFHFADDWAAGESVYFEGVEFNGDNNTYGFAIQKKNAGTSANASIGSIIYKNCNITGYSKGLIYEWGKTMEIGELTWQDCVISNVNQDGTQGGDVVDIRNASTISKLNIVNNTIYQGMRTFLRFDTAPTVGDVKIENNTLQNLCFVDNTNNAGIFGFQVAPSSISFKQNLFLNFVTKSVLGSENTKYKTADDIALSGSDNWFYNVHDAFFTTSYPASKAGYNKLNADPCYNAKGGVFNILASSDIAGKQIGASKWWAPYIEMPEDTTLVCLEGPTVWDFSDATVFNKTDIKKHIVRGDLFIGGSEVNQIKIEDGVMQFVSATACNRKGFPLNGYLKFVVDKSGSVVVRTSGGEGANITVGTSTTDGVIKVVGGAATMTGSTTPTKIVIPDIEEETTIYVYASNAIGIDQLAWSEDVSEINTALPAPVPTANPTSMTSGESTDITVTWEAVPNAGGYIAEFKGKQYTVEEGALSFTVEGKMTSMLDKGSYTVNIYASPLSTDIYNTVSEAGSASFAVLPSGGGGETELVVKTVDELKSAIGAGKTAITLDAATFDLSTDAEWSGTLPITGAVALKGKDGAKVIGAIAITGEVGDVSFENITFTQVSDANFIEFKNDPQLVASSVTVAGCTIDGYKKSAIYCPASQTTTVDKILFIGNTLQNMGAGQGTIDLRSGTYGEIKIFGNTVIGGRDFIRYDSSCSGSSLDISNNTFDGVTINNKNSILYVRATLSKYTVNKNLFLNEVAGGSNGTWLSKSGTAVPTNMSKNYYYIVDETNFWKGPIDSTTATFKGAILNDSPVKDLANHDYTLTNGVLIADKVGAPQWQPSATYCDAEKITVKNAEEFQNALDAGKVEIILAAAGSPYTFDESSSFEIPANLHIVGESGSLPEFHGCFTMSGAEDLGTVIFDNIKFCGDATLGCVFTTSGTPSARNITVKNCTVDGFTKSVYYGSGAATVQALVFSGVNVQNHGTGQSVFDIRNGACSSLTISNCTITGGRELVRADANKITDCLNFTNNTVYGSNLGINDKSIMYVRATPTVYKFTNNLFLGEKADGKTVLLGKSGVTVPTTVGKNFVWDYDETNFFTAPLTQEVTGFSTLSYCPVKDAANGDYTLTDALCLSSNIGALTWNPNRGRVTSEITVTNLEEFINALSAGKTAISVKADTIDFTAAPAEATAFSGGVLSLESSLTIAGIKTYGKDPVIKGAFKLNTGVGSFIAQNLVFDGKNKAIGNLFEVAGALETSKIIVKSCEIKEYSKSIFYGNSEGNVGSASFSNLLVHDMGKGQGMFDFRKKVYGSIVLENSTFYNGGRDFIRLDQEIAGSISIRNNTFSSVSIEADNSILYVRNNVGDKYTLENNLFLNETGTKTILAKVDASKPVQVPVVKNNFFFNCTSTAFWSGSISQEAATANGGGVLDADPCTDSANAKFKLTNQDLKKLGVGDPRWR